MGLYDGFSSPNSGGQASAAAPGAIQQPFAFSPGQGFAAPGYLSALSPFLGGQAQPAAQQSGAAQPSASSGAIVQSPSAPSIGIGGAPITQSGPLAGSPTVPSPTPSPALPNSGLSGALAPFSGQFANGPSSSGGWGNIPAGGWNDLRGGGQIMPPQQQAWPGLGSPGGVPNFSFMTGG